MFESALSLHYTGSSNKTETHNDVTTAVTHVNLVLDSLTPEIARQLGRDVHDLCFSKDGRIHDQLSKITVKLREPQQHVTVKMAVDVSAHVELDNVRIPTIVIAKRGEDKDGDVERKSRKVAPAAETLRATINCLMLPESSKAREFLTQMPGKTFFFEFEDEERQLDFGPDPDDDDPDDNENQGELDLGGPKLTGKSKKDRPITDGEIRSALKECSIELRPAHLKALTAQHREEVIDWVRVCREIREAKGDALVFDDLPPAMSYLLNPAELGIAPAPDADAGDILEDQAPKAKSARAPRRSSKAFKNSPRVVKMKPKAKKGGK